MVKTMLIYTLLGMGAGFLLWALAFLLWTLVFIRLWNLLG